MYLRVLQVLSLSLWQKKKPWIQDQAPTTSPLSSATSTGSPLLRLWPSHDYSPQSKKNKPKQNKQILKLVTTSWKSRAVFMEQVMFLTEESLVITTVTEAATSVLSASLPLGRCDPTIGVPPYCMNNTMWMHAFSGGPNSCSPSFQWRAWSPCLERENKSSGQTVVLSQPSCLRESTNT